MVWHIRPIAWSRGRIHSQTFDASEIELLVRSGCHLCDDALRTLMTVFSASSIVVTDISGNSALEDEFVFRIPVVRCRGVVMAEGVISYSDARTLRSAAQAMWLGRDDG